MEIFNIVAGVSSIVSLFISIISLIKVNDVQRKINKTHQSIENTSIDNNSSVIQVGRDYIK